MPDEIQFKKWRKAKRSNDANDCVEVSYDQPGFIAVRDSKDGAAGPILKFTRSEWDAFADGVRNDEFPSPS